MQGPAWQLCFVKSEPGPPVNDPVEESAGVREKEEIAGVVEVVTYDAKDFGGELVEYDVGEVCQVCGCCF